IYGDVGDPAGGDLGRRFRLRRLRVLIGASAVGPAIPHGEQDTQTQRQAAQRPEKAFLHGKTPLFEKSGFGIQRASGHKRNSPAERLRKSCRPSWEKAKHSTRSRSAPST